MLFESIILALWKIILQLEKINSCAFAAKTPRKNIDLRVSVTTATHGFEQRKNRLSKQ